MQVEKNSASSSLEIVHYFQGESKGNFGDAFVPRDGETNHDPACIYGVLQQGPPFGIATQHLVHNRNIRFWQLSRRPVSQLKLGSAPKPVGLGQFIGDADHLGREVEPEGVARSFL